MRFAPAVSALALILAACGSGSSNSAHHDGEAEGHAEAGAHGEEHAAESHGSLLGPSEAHAATHAPQHQAENASAHWSYADQRAWAGVAGLCGRGEEQSPINLSSAAPMAEVPDLIPHYLPVDGGLINNGHTLQFSPALSTATLSIGSDEYTLAQFHFHSPAEHLLDHRAYPLELHFVHRNEGGQLAVVGVFIEQGPENSAIAALLSHKPDQAGEAFSEDLEVNLMALLPPDRAYFAYAGSLTTPPCSEGVRWNVMRTPITASAEQIAALREALGASSRHPQPINERTVLLGA
ncbi:MAG: carbonic anhydrase family protein [Hyphomonadaceae bacterium]